MLCKLLQALDALVIWENVTSLAIVEAFHLHFPCVVLVMVVVETGAGIQSSQELAQSLGHLRAGRLVGGLIADQRRLCLDLLLQSLLGELSVFKRAILLNLANKALHHVLNILLDLFERVDCEGTG